MPTQLEVRFFAKRQALSSTTSGMSFRTTTHAVPFDVWRQVFEGDYIHYQWTGSDANANNEGQGRAKTDRSNLLQYDAQDSNMPVLPAAVAMAARQRHVAPCFATLLRCPMDLQAKIFYYDEFGDPATHEKPLFVGRDGKPNRTLYALMVSLGVGFACPAVMKSVDPALQ